MHVLKWLRAQEPPCPWDGFACFCAAGKGQLGALQWLRAQTPPCAWDRDACRRIARDEKFPLVVAWIDGGPSLLKTVVPGIVRVGLALALVLILNSRNYERS